MIEEDKNHKDLRYKSKKLSINQISQITGNSQTNRKTEKNQKNESEAKSSKNIVTIKHELYTK